jgi:hypothetical protein
MELILSLKVRLQNITFLLSGDRDQLHRLDPTEYVLPEDGDRIQSPKRCVLKDKQDDVLDKDKRMNNVQKHNICTYV